MPWSKTKFRSPEEIARIKAIRAAAKKRFRSNPKNRETERQYRQSQRAKEQQRACWARYQSDGRYQSRIQAYNQRPYVKEGKKKYRDRPENKERMRDYTRQWYLANKERIAARGKQRWINDPQLRASRAERNRRYKKTAKRKAYDREYNRRPEVKAATRARQFRDRQIPEKAERQRKQQERWRKTKAGRKWYAEKDRRRRAQKMGRPTDRLILSWERKWRRKRKVTCYWCRTEHPPKECHMDHIVALANGGPHTIDNVCISCRLCNVRKQAKTLEQWNRHLEQPALL